MKPGPKKGWADEMRRNVELHKSVALHHQSMANLFEARAVSLKDRIDNFNTISFWSKVLFLLKGGRV